MEEERIRKEEEDGWTVVKRKSKAISVGDVQVKKHKKEKDTHDFYNFSLKEDKKNKLIKLREQFEKDKEKIIKMKNSRKFKPF